MLTNENDKLDGLRTYIDGKLKRYNLLFAVNGGAFAIAKLTVDPQNGVVLGKLTVPILAWGAIAFTALVTIDIWLWARMMKKEFLGSLAFNLPGKSILLSLGLLIIAAWSVVALGP